MLVVETRDRISIETIIRIAIVNLEARQHLLRVSSNNDDIQKATHGSAQPANKSRTINIPRRRARPLARSAIVNHD
ncbi:hypothetical protein EVAR_9640_1 [Eumeta japonica]|uniref:Uncharacterized protein n=1 Tax=Eumeta variegata TaxID=151549 RepID=A0A4C1TMS4_EUMVA|nr:hypothetical protein EVAR_9640_1 [Eumeta japonica]